MTFFLMGICSGVCSGVFAAIPPMGLIVPGAAFGVALAIAMNTTGGPLPMGRPTMLIGASMLAYSAAIVSSLFASRLCGIGNGIVGGACIGSIGGWVGAFGLALAVIVIGGSMNVIKLLLVVSLTGGILEAILVTLSIYLADQLSAPREVRDFIHFSVWQAGVATAIAQCHRPPESEDD